MNGLVQDIEAGAAGTRRNVIDTATEPARLCTICGPSSHRDGVVEVIPADADADAETDTERLDGRTAQ